MEEKLYAFQRVYQLQVGDRIKSGDFWQDQFGTLHMRERVGWFEKIKPQHCPHFRIYEMSPEPRT